MKTTGVVVEVFGNKAKVDCERRDACEFCENKDSCIEKKCESVKVTVLNNIGADMGDTVEIETDTGRVLKLSFLIFTLPIFICIAVYFIFSSVLSGEISAVISVISLCVSMAVSAFLLDKKVKGKEAGEITRIIR